MSASDPNWLQSSRRGGGVFPSPILMQTTQLVRRRPPGARAIGYSTSFSCMSPAITMVSPSRYGSFSIAPRHIMMPCQRMPASSGCSEARAAEWMPSAAIGEFGGHAVRVLRESDQAMAGTQGVGGQALPHGVPQHALQLAAMDGEL